MIKTLPQIIAHRGASQFAPENTLPAFELAKIMEARMCECDVQLSSDNVPVIMHDDTVDRTTNGHGVVHNLSFQELKNLNIRNNFKLHDYQFANPLSIPSLQETLTWCVHNNMALNLELKVNQHAPDTPLVAEVLKVIRPMPVVLADLMLVSSFDWDKLAEFHELAPEFAIGILIDEGNFQHYGLNGIQAMALELNALSLNLDVKLLHPELIKTLKAWVPYVLAYTVNDAAEAEHLFAQGLDGVFSNNPLLLQKVT